MYPPSHSSRSPPLRGDDSPRFRTITGHQQSRYLPSPSIFRTLEITHPSALSCSCAHSASSPPHSDDGAAGGARQSHGSRPAWPGPGQERVKPCGEHVAALIPARSSTITSSICSPCLPRCRATPTSHRGPLPARTPLLPPPSRHPHLPIRRPYLPRRAARPCFPCRRATPTRRQELLRPDLLRRDVFVAPAGVVTYLANTDGRRKRTSGGSACSTPSKAPTARTCPSSASPAGPTHPPPHHRPPGLLSGAPRLPDRHLPPGASCLPWDFDRV
ncbi:hypothetical protein PVAP13_5NG448358 [Panicum virgatum]|uniref:Uncharacterized protein n=1 Tax=Panicum virgatum TaxID=38727 RepID=A0A8T0S4L4_PANVG|nr:hypothetical protein PVAP13_5NG448358 [Panicum virgatum]